MNAPSPPLPDWTRQSEPVDGVQIDIGFVISQTFYYGPENDFSAEQWEALREPLQRPTIPIVAEHFVLSADCVGKEDELCRHYRDVLDKATRHGKDPRRGAYFWNRPVVHAPDGLVLSFPWHDHFIDGRLFIESLAAGEVDAASEVFSVFSYCEQGWEFELHLHKKTLYMREGDPDSGTTHHNLRFAHEPVRAQVAGVLARVEALIARLTREFGQDYWTTGN